jgi:hypothetical protein
LTSLSRDTLNRQQDHEFSDFPVDSMALALRGAVDAVVEKILREPRSLDVVGDDLLTIGDAPHAWPFPKVAAVAHHCGVGTTVAGLRADTPTIGWSSPSMPYCTNPLNVVSPRLTRRSLLPHQHPNAEA